MKVYFISGLAADSRVFKNIILPIGYEAIYLDWIKPQQKETLRAYALRLAAPIDTSEPFSLVGLSMGGMIATEIANEYDPTACILLCSVPTHNHLPAHFKWAYFLRLHKLIPVSVFKKASMLNRDFMPDSLEDKTLLKQIIRESDPAFIRWAIHAILSWKNEIIPQPLWQIHGTKDGILPIRFTHPTHRVQDANHLMIMSRAKELNEFLREVLETTKIKEG